MCSNCVNSARKGTEVQKGLSWESDEKGVLGQINGTPTCIERCLSNKCVFRMPDSARCRLLRKSGFQRENGDEARVCWQAGFQSNYVEREGRKGQRRGEGPIRLCVGDTGTLLEI